MREIKFRAWDKVSEIMWHWNLKNLGCSDIGELKGEDNGCSDLTNILKKCPVMQYTGLKDKNGKEIYCSDIVKGYFNEEEVIDSIWLTLTEEDKKNGYLTFQLPDNIVDFARESYPDELEVIGNIYENPELLEKETK